MGSSGPIRLGLTGSLGAGKSTALNFFSRQGWEVVSADQIVHEIYKEGGEELAQLRRDCLKSPAALKRLERRIHPEVRRRIFAKLKSAKRNIVVEIPLLFEGKLQKHFDYTICVHAPKKERKLRAKKRGMSSKLFDFLDSKQWPPSKKAAAADFVLWNRQGQLPAFRRALRMFW